VTGMEPLVGALLAGAAEALVGRLLDPLTESVIRSSKGQLPPHPNHRARELLAGYITRTYGQPADNIHVLQLELTWRTYMEEVPPYQYLPERAARLKPVLRRMLETGLTWAAGRTR